MPLRSTHFCLVLALPALYFGCGSAAPPHARVKTSDHREFARYTRGARPERMIIFTGSNRFVGDWGPIPGYVANNWIARFTADGRMSIEGPGLTARGYYVAHGTVAEVSYRWRDGMEPTEAKTAHARYRISDNGELSFATGIKDDPPVHLRMIK